MKVEPEETLPMDDDYLPPHATIEQACAWLNAKTGKTWGLPRLLEYGMKPWFWLDYKPGWPQVFGDRLEGFLAPVLFGGDTQRLAIDGGDVLVTITQLPDGRIVNIDPGMPGKICDLRFKREDLKRLASKFADDNGATAESTRSVGRPLQRHTAQEEAITHIIRDMGLDPKNLPARKPGKQGTKAQVRDKLRQHPLFTGNTIFDKAWDRLRTNGTIAGAD